MPNQEIPPDPPQGEPHIQSAISVESDEWKRRNSYHAFSFDESGAYHDLNISETALVNAVKYGGIQWVHQCLSELAKNPVDLAGVRTDSLDDRILRYSVRFSDEDDLVGTFSFFVTFNPEHSSFRVHVFGFLATDPAAPTATGASSTGKDGIDVGLPTVPTIERMRRGEPEIAFTEPAGLFSFTTHYLSAVRRRFIGAKPARNGRRAISSILNVVAANAQAEGKVQVAEMTKRAVRFSVKMAAKLIGSLLQ